VRPKSARTGLNLSAVVDTMAVVPPRDPGIAIRLHAARDGAKAASWLIWQCRRLFIRSGEVDFKIPESEETPPYIRVALAYLQLAPRHREKWVVVTFHRGDERVYRVRWADWEYYGAWRASGCPKTTLARSPIAPDGPQSGSPGGTPRGN
jgi:hypothetical protein